MGETVTLNVEISGDSSAGQRTQRGGDFDLLGTQGSSSVSIVNGQTSRNCSGSGLQQACNLTIPAFTVGSAQNESAGVTVLPAQPVPSARLATTCSSKPSTPRSRHVQREIRPTVKLYYALSLIDGNLDDPKLEGLVVRKLGQTAITRPISTAAAIAWSNATIPRARTTAARLTAADRPRPRLVPAT